ncbi:MAG: hypothetical protein DRP93_01265 [Candidatus Neomarinimicrobiota bacterium]|nr:MAG: hypothetical protein DRP93_01265 [Candidatus Neomarinimicrobiota bacterium]
MEEIEKEINCKQLKYCCLTLGLACVMYWMFSSIRVDMVVTAVFKKYLANLNRFDFNSQRNHWASVIAFKYSYYEYGEIRQQFNTFRTLGC